MGICVNKPMPETFCFFKDDFLISFPLLATRDRTNKRNITTCHCFVLLKYFNELLNHIVFAALPAPITIDKAHFRECLLEALSEMFGPECISPLIRGDKMSVTVDDKTALIDLNTLVGTVN